LDRLRELLANLRAQLGKLTPTHMLLVAFVAITLALVLFIVAQNTAKPSMAEVLPNAAPDQQQTALAHLQANGFEAKQKNGRVVVRHEEAQAARAALAEGGLMPGDKQILYENILRQQSWTNTTQQNAALFNNALENELARTIERFDGVKSAKVFIDAPPPMGLGSAVRKPTASVSVTTRGGQAMSQAMVDAVAGFIAGSKAGLVVENVRVIDGASGRQRRASREDDVLPTTYLEHAARVEAQTHEKVSELLGYIPGVVVAVTAQVDVTRVERSVNSALPTGQGSVSLPLSEETSETNDSAASAGGAAPGVEANQTADIMRSGGGGGTRSTANTSNTTYENHVGTKVEKTVDPRGFPTLVAISVNVPRSFVARLAHAESGRGASSGGADPAAGEPTEAQVREVFEKRVRPTILETLTPQVRALSMQMGGSVTPEQLQAMVAQSVGVSLIPFDVPEPTVQTAGVLGSILNSGGGGGGLLGSGIVDKVVLGTLALVALGMMFTLVKKSTKKAELPSAEELVGMPPTLEGGSEVVGEAEESETAMAGIEVGDLEMESQKKLEQVTSMVDQNAEMVARLLNRWIQTDE